MGWHVFDSDNSGNTYTTGRFSGTVSFGDITLSSVGSSDIFVVKTNSSGLVLWAERFGGGGEDFGVAITTDNLGNIYTTGSFNGTASFGSYTFTSNTNERSIYVVKQNTSGQVLWATQFSSPWTTIPQDFLSIGITTDTQGNIYTTGTFRADTATFGDITLERITLGFSPYDTFVVKQNTSGQVLWAKNFGVTDIASGNWHIRSWGGITTDTLDNIYISGYFSGTAVFDDITLTGLSGIGSAFVTKIDSSGEVIWAKRFGEEGAGFNALSRDITTDIFGNVYVTGSFSGVMNVGSTTLTSSYNSEYDYYMGDVFVMKIDSSGEGLWAINSTTTSGTSGYSIVVDTLANMYITGYFDGTVNFGDTTLVSEGLSDVFVLKINSSGTVEWGDSFGSTGSDLGVGVSVDTAEGIYIMGGFSGTVNFGETILTAPNSGEIFLMKIAMDGNLNLEWSNIEKYNFYPNPVKDVLTIQFPENVKGSTVELYNQIGQKVKEFIIYDDIQNLDLSDLATGVYFLKTSNNTIKIKKQ